jgi:hypothetical protein
MCDVYMRARIDERKGIGIDDPASVISVWLWSIPVSAWVPKFPVTGLDPASAFII